MHAILGDSEALQTPSKSPIVFTTTRRPGSSSTASTMKLSS
jgi:hypothetical protein